jgi:shikimate kinase
MKHHDARLDQADNAALAQRVAQRITRPIVLVGMMGVGKSSVGKRLAALLHLPFVDADEAIEQAAQMTIPEIFETYGEAYFRDGERRVIQRLIAESVAGRPMVIATGGGAFVNAETRALILDKAIAVWLDSDIDTLLQRVGRKDNRPLLRTGNPRETLTRLREERAPAYAQAPVHVVSSNQPHGATLAAVMKGILACQ